MIALHCYCDFFEEKKHYRALTGSHCLGVFRFNDYIIRIDDSPYSFINERDVFCALKQKEGTSDNIVVPFLTYINIKKDENNKMCECNTIVCGCKYDDGEDHYEKINMMSHDGKHYYNSMRKNSISFSIQHYAKNTEQLYHWVKDNIGNSIYNQFSNIQYPFFVNLFFKCAQLIRDLHNADVVHGDIKPDNILIREHDNFNLHNVVKCKNFTVYLIDFGLSGMNNEGFGTGGTIPYCHPEFKNIRDTSRTSKYNWKRQQLKHDVWSLGIVFITMYIYRDFYSYYHKYPDYFFTKEGYVSSLILDVIADSKLHEIFTKILSEDSISIHEVCTLLEAIDK
jgi:serine/threonine protein kinase